MSTKRFYILKPFKSVCNLLGDMRYERVNLHSFWCDIIEIVCGYSSYISKTCQFESMFCAWIFLAKSATFSKL